MSVPEGMQSPSLERSYAGTTETLNQARIDLSVLLGNHGHQALIADAQLVLSELISNAVEASPGEPYEVTARVGQHHVQIEVTNISTAQLPDREDWQPKDVLAPQGRGLSIVRALSESVQVITTGTKLTIVARLPVSAA